MLIYAPIREFLAPTKGVAKVDFDFLWFADVMIVLGVIGAIVYKKSQ